jgi:hypothetical protein
MRERADEPAEVQNALEELTSPCAWPYHQNMSEQATFCRSSETPASICTLKPLVSRVEAKLSSAHHPQNGVVDPPGRSRGSETKSVPLSIALQFCR